jgi:hypothetical protein
MVIYDACVFIVIIILICRSVCRLYVKIHDPDRGDHIPDDGAERGIRVGRGYGHTVVPRSNTATVRGRGVCVRNSVLQTGRGEYKN